MEAVQTQFELISYENIPPDKHLIYKELEKHLLLGQWEFARALVHTILAEDSTEKNNIKQTLRKIAANPGVARIQAPVISSSHLSWLVCTLLQEISSSENDFSKKCAEFSLVLCDLLPEVQPSVFEELQNWYTEALKGIICGACTIERFSPDCCVSLQTALLQNPCNISYLIDQLIFAHEAFRSTNTQIFAIYLQCILHCSKEIEGNSSVSKEKKTQSVKKLLSLFSVFPELEERYYEADVKQLLAKCLSDLVKLHVTKVVDVTEIYSALLTRKSPQLLQLFSIEDDTLFSQPAENQGHTHISGNFSYNVDGESWFRKMYLQCVNKKTHFLSVLLDDATRYLVEGKVEEAWGLMENPLLHRLQPLLIILAWKSCSTDKSASNILHIMKSWKPVQNTDPVFLEIFQKLQYNLHITDWCIEKLRLLQLGYDDSVFISRRRNIFNQLLSQSPLCILHKTVGLKNIRYDDMLSLLKFSKGEDEKTSGENILALSNSMVFRGYLSVMHVMDAIGACCRIEQSSFMYTDNRTSIENWFVTRWNQQKSEAEDKLLLNDSSMESSGLNNSSTQANIDKLSIEEFVDGYGFQSAYSHFVTEQLLKTKNELNQLYPIEFRVEILENIFSLLFVKGNDFQDSDTNNYDTVDNDVGEEQNNTQTNPTASQHTSGSDFGRISENGFLCNELIIRDILAILKEIHLDTTSAVYMMLADERSSNLAKKETVLKSGQLGNTSLPFIKSSITKATLQQRMSRLLKYINEAQWRFELVASDLVPRDFGMCGKYFCKKSRRIFKFVPQESSNTRDKGSEHFSSSSGREESRVKRRANKHNTHHTSLGMPDWQEVGFIHYMLASPSDLLCHSLWRQNYEQAKQVIQLFNLQTTYEASEAYFTENYATLIKEIESFGAKQKSSVKQNISIVNPGDDGMKASSVNHDMTLMRVSALAEAAAAGVQSTAITSLVDKLLSSIPSPIIPDFIEMRENKVVANILAECKELNGVVLADCVYTANTTLETEITILQMAMKRLKFFSAAGCSAGKSKQKCLHSIKGIARILEQNSALSEEINKCQQGRTHNLPSFFMPESTCCRDIVTLLGSLDHKTYKEQVGSWQKFIDKIREVETLLEQDSQVQAETSETALETQNQLYLSFQTLAKICSVNLRFLATDIVPNKAHKYLNYLKVMHDHICHVSEALSRCRSQSYSTDSVSSTSYFSVLKESPSDVLSKMMLQNGIPPTKLESFAAQMKVDLVHVITQKCFPHIPSSAFTVSLPEPEAPCSDEHIRPCIILNSFGNVWSCTRHPELAAREILSEVLSIFHDECMAADTAGILTLPIAISMLKGQRLKSWMASTTEIAQVDVSLLKSKEEKLAFFGNLCNIIWIHAIFRELDLAIQSKQHDDFHHLKSNKLKNQPLHLPILSPSVIERLIHQKIYAYQIGESHILSLLDLRYRILHTGFSMPSHISLSALSYLFDFSDDEEITVGVEPRLLFAICEGFVSSPKLQVLYPETVVSQLDDAMRDYLCFHVEADCQEEKVKLPELLNWYSQDFAGDDYNDWSRANYQGLVTLVTSYVKGALQNNLQSLLGLGSIHGFSEYIDKDGKNILPFAVEFKPFTTEFGIIFDYDAARLENVFSDNKLHFVTKPDYYQISHQTHITEYLRNKCWMLSVFLGMTINENDEEPEENEESKAKTLAIKLTPETPLTRLMTHMQEIWCKAMGDSCKTNDLTWIVSALTPYHNRAFIWHCLDASIRREDWSAVLDCLLHMESANTLYDYRLIKDVVLQYLASFAPGVGPHFQEPWSYALRISDTERKANCVLSNITSWPEETCIKVLKACLADERIMNHSDSQTVLTKKFKEITLYQKILQVTSRVVRFESEMGFNTWQDIARLSVESPKIVLECIKNTEQHHLALEWAKLHPVEPDTEQLLAEMHISSLLDQDPPKILEAEEILSSLKEDIVTTVCYTLMKTLNSCESKIFLVQYSLKHLDFTNRENEKENLNKLFLGLKSMSAIKEVKRRQYEHLLHSPYLLLEQLLMNMQIDTVGNALKIMSNVPFVNDILPLSSIDQLLEQYAEKALEIAVAEGVAVSSSSDTSSSYPLLPAPEKFAIPLSVPRKDEWVPDGQVRNCMVCQTQQFSMFNRRHHCRRCGRVVCQACSQHKVFVEGYENVLVRICDDCYEQLYPGDEELPASYSPSSLEQRIKYSATGRSSPKYYGMPPHRESISRRRGSICLNTESQWLGKDEVNNANIREEFYYEQAPSVSLCLSILKLHSDLKKCSSFVMGQCNKLFNMLIPKVACTPNPEIDYALVISMIRSLLLNIKLKLSEAGIEDGAEYVDTYSTFLDLIKQLVNENCVHLLPEDAITTDIAIRKIRDALQKEEKMTLAIEVAAKYSLDTFGIWATWGKTFLQIGDWTAAREKFAHCLKKPKDRSQYQNESALLKDILNLLESTTHRPIERDKSVMRSLTSLKAVQSGVTNLDTSTTFQHDKLDHLVLKECFYYLENYAYHFTYVYFYQKHGMICEAVNYIMKERCDNETFIEGLFLPCAKSGMLHKLKTAISSQDHSLKTFRNYLIATCKYLKRNSYYNLLHEVQLYMKDYIRAAMTNMWFFQEPVENYTELASQLHHLLDAKKSLEIYLKSQESYSYDGSARKVEFLLTLPHDVVKKHIRRIDLQIKVTKYFAEWESENKVEYPVIHSQNKELDAGSFAVQEAIPTLLGDRQAKNQIAAMIVVNCKDIKRGLQMASEVIQEFQLNWIDIIELSSNTLLKCNCWNKVPCLIECACKDYNFGNSKWDEMILSCVRTSVEFSIENAEVERLINLISSIGIKVQAYIVCGKLMSAYRIASRNKRPSDIQKILLAAREKGQHRLSAICEQWLQSNIKEGQH